MKKITLQLILIALISVSCNSLKNKKETTTITGTWVGYYSWNCREKGNEKITINIIDINGKISGDVSFKEEEYKIKGFRLIDAKLGEWRYENGRISPKGDNIVLHFLNQNESKIIINTFSGKLEGSFIAGITQNGENCSTYKGPSGNFKITKLIK